MSTIGASDQPLDASVGVEVEVEVEVDLESYRQQELLRFLICGGVGVGQSTLIGRLLHDLGAISEQQLALAEQDSKKFGSNGAELDFALLVEDFDSEREQKPRFVVEQHRLATAKRKFILVNVSNQEQNTGSLAIAASSANLAVILVDACNGVLEQTRRYAFIATLLGIKHIVVAVNKMDRINYDQAKFEAIRNSFMDFAAKLQVTDIHFIPLSAVRGDNVIQRSQQTSWFEGSPLLNFLETVNIASDRNLIDLRFAIQNVLQLPKGLYAYAGYVVSGVLRRDDEVVVLPSGKRNQVQSIVTYDRELEEAFAPMVVTVILAETADLQRGDVLVHSNNAPRFGTTLEVMLVWMSDQALLQGQQYLLKHTTVQTSATVTQLNYRINTDTLHREQTEELNLNEIGRLRLQTSRPLAFDAYQKNRGSGAFILIDRASRATVGAGMIVDRQPAETALARRSEAADAGSNVRAQRWRSAISAAERAQHFKQTPFIVWLTGLPRSGKSSIAFALEQALFQRGFTAHVLDGENLRLGISSDLGFSTQDRWENQRRAAEIAKLSYSLGLITIVALVSPLNVDRAQARRLVGTERFIEVFCNASLAICEQRDNGGLYQRARAGELQNVTGINAPFEKPAGAEIELDTVEISVSDNVAILLMILEGRGFLKR